MTDEEFKRWREHSRDMAVAGYFLGFVSGLLLLGFFLLWNHGH